MLPITTADRTASVHRGSRFHVFLSVLGKQMAWAIHWYKAEDRKGNVNDDAWKVRREGCYAVYGFVCGDKAKKKCSDSGFLARQFWPPRIKNFLFFLWKKLLICFTPAASGVDKIYFRIISLLVFCRNTFENKQQQQFWIYMHLLFNIFRVCSCIFREATSFLQVTCNPSPILKISQLRQYIWEAFNTETEYV